MSKGEGLKGGLQSRHMTMISIAGVIGAALFVGSGKQIALAGPAVILAYLGGGILAFLVMRMLGEMAVAQPDTGSFSTYADRAIGRWAGFTIGWLYWYFWALLMGWEAYVAGQILHGWFPVAPNWVYALLLTLGLIGVNFMNVRNYGEFEFWFGLIKVVAIVLFLVVGTLAVVHLWPFGDAGGMSNLTDRGFMPNGPGAVVTALLGIMFAMMGAEVVTVAAGETSEPGGQIVKAIRSVVWRICLFYVGSIFLVVCLVPYDTPALVDPTRGSYNVVLDAMGIPYAQLIVNAIVLTSVCSCFNSALYVSSRMLYSLARRGDAHRIMAVTGASSGAPYVGVVISSVFAFVAVYMMATSSMDLYDVLMQTTGCVALFVYLTIACCQLRMRQRLQAQGAELKFKMWLFPWLTWAVILFICAALLTMVLEGTYRQEVLYTSALGAVIVLMGVAAQRFGIGGPKAHEPSARKILEQGFNGRREAAALKP
ncbi:amino acid permease [Achromobacter sp. ACM03]|uniref:amino acid permease n=1 Tax=Achromobacter sp. ACM03 TaxID=2769300 RepID=UPI0017820C14|nr:amino acid permease [Achromobacter sp. ACM03]MBD9431857.1 amino acid permease [Achromobacter sp. ACM03]